MCRSLHFTTSLNKHLWHSLKQSPVNNNKDVCYMNAEGEFVGMQTLEEG